MADFKLKEMKLLKAILHKKEFAIYAQGFIRWQN